MLPSKISIQIPTRVDTSVQAPFVHPALPLKASFRNPSDITNSVVRMFSGSETWNSITRDPQQHANFNLAIKVAESFPSRT